MTNPLLVPDITRAIREAQELKPVEEEAVEVPADEDAALAEIERAQREDGAEADEETEEEAARKDKMRRIPNRQMTRNMINQKGEEQQLRPRIRRRIYAQRRKFDAK